MSFSRHTIDWTWKEVYDLTVHVILLGKAKVLNREAARVTGVPKTR